MPLEDKLPILDDRRYDDILAEIRTRISRYTPEWEPVWTDLNDSDPGITMAQVFAWLADMLLFRLGRVPELSYLKFLQLLGIELQPAAPARTEITFPVKAGHPAATVSIPPRTQVTAQSPEGDGPPVIFETERALVALAAPLAAVQAFDGFAYTDVAEANAAATAGFSPFGPLAKDGGALLLGFPPRNAQPFPEVEVDLAVFVFEEAAGAVECGPAAISFAPALVRWEYWDGTIWQPLERRRDETRALTRSGRVLVKTPLPGRMQPAVIGVVPDSLFWLRARVERSQYERAPRLRAIRTNTVAALQAQTVRDEVLGGSNGRRDQVFRLANTPVLADTLRIEVDEGDGYKLWTRVDDLFGSGPADKHYALNPATGEVRFGDGVNGDIPTGNAGNPTAGVIAREYRCGGGKRGNVAAGAIKTLVGSIPGLDDGKIANLLAAHSGRDEETLAAAKKRAPGLVRSRGRAVTTEDYEYFATQSSTIRRARALPLSHPDFPGVRVPGVISVIVVPDSDAPNPIPSDGTLRAVCAYLDERRLLTTELYVLGPTYHPVRVRVEATVEDNADAAEVSDSIDKTLLDYFHPLRGGEDGQGWPFGGTIFYSRVYQRVFTVPGVQSIGRLVITVDGEAAPECRDVPIPEGSLVYSTEHDVQAGYGFEAEP